MDKICFEKKPSGRLEAILLCASCGSNYTHHREINIYEREIEDAVDGWHMSVDIPTKKVSLDSSMNGNPSHRRGGLTISFSCEACQAITELSIIQHKGYTYMEVYVREVSNPSDVILNAETIQFPAHPGYEIDTTRINNAQDVLSWAHHLSTKNWVTNDMIAEFIERACDYRNIDIFGEP